MLFKISEWDLLPVVLGTDYGIVSIKIANNLLERGPKRFIAPFNLTNDEGILDRTNNIIKVAFRSGNKNKDNNRPSAYYNP